MREHSFPVRCTYISAKNLFGNISDLVKLTRAQALVRNPKPWITSSRVAVAHKRAGTMAAASSSYFSDLISDQTYPKRFIGPPVSRSGRKRLPPEVTMSPPSKRLIKTAQTRGQSGVEDLASADGSCQCKGGLKVAKSV